MNDTIVAQATPPGRGAVSIVRLSGPQAVAIAECLVGHLPPPRHAALRKFVDAQGTTIDSGIVIHYPAPHSYTGEEIVELQGHGGHVAPALVLKAARAAGARSAEPGEFSRRACLNDRMDLAQAEAVADLIDATTETAAQAAQRSLSGVFSQKVEALEQALVEIRVRVEGALDFSDEDAQWFDSPLQAAMTRAEENLGSLLKAGTRGRRLTEGFVAAIAGQPNVGKSTLLNYLSGEQAAIVTDVPGTTRDVLRESIDLDGLPLTLIDTAGLRDSVDPIEREGVARARAVFARCELIIYLVDARAGLGREDALLLASLPEAVPRLIVFNKLDLLDKKTPDADDAIPISAATGAGVEKLIGAIREHAGLSDTAGAFSMRSRHLEALKTTREHLANARASLDHHHDTELAAEELRMAQQALGEICGNFGSEELLGRIFAGFCIGK